jgi:hypothetical protein
MLFFFQGDQLFLFWIWDINLVSDTIFIFVGAILNWVGLYLAFGSLLGKFTFALHRTTSLLFLALVFHIIGSCLLWNLYGGQSVFFFVPNAAALADQVEAIDQIIAPQTASTYIFMICSYSTPLNI